MSFYQSGEHGTDFFKIMGSDCRPNIGLDNDFHEPGPGAKIDLAGPAGEGATCLVQIYSTELALDACYNFCRNKDFRNGNTPRTARELTHGLQESYAYAFDTIRQLPIRVLN